MSSDIRRAAPVVERFDVFDVQQVTRGTALESIVAADMVCIGPYAKSQVHRHLRSETVLFILEGAAVAIVGDDRIGVQAGDRILIGKSVYHGFETAASALRFLSVQSPPILDESTGRLDLEPR
jgi:mannose-6-phosphate isomerase-like protein (cupin superfamily)